MTTPYDPGALTTAARACMRCWSQSTAIRQAPQRRTAGRSRRGGACVRACMRACVRARPCVWQERYTGAQQGRVGTSQAARTRKERRGEQRRGAPREQAASRGTGDGNTPVEQAEQEGQGNEAANGGNNSPEDGRATRAPPRATENQLPTTNRTQRQDKQARQARRGNARKNT